VHKAITTSNRIRRDLNGIVGTVVVVADFGVAAAFGIACGDVVAGAVLFTGAVVVDAVTFLMASHLPVCKITMTITK
jgi:hypothetical protein